MKWTWIVLLWLASALTSAQDTYLGVYLGDSKLGYTSYSQREEPYLGKPARRMDSRNVINAGLLGQGMSMKMSSTSWSTLEGKPIRMRFLIESGGRSQLMDAAFEGTKIRVTSTNSGKVERKTLTIPADGQVTDDPMLGLIAGGAAPGARRVAYVLDPMTVSLVKTSAVLRGPAKVEVKGQTFDATQIDLDDPRAPLKMFVSAKGDLIKAEGPFGIFMVPESKEEALGPASTSYRPSTDLAITSSLRTDKPIGNPASLKRLVLRISGQDLSRLPSGDHQSVKRDGASWVVDIHPPQWKVGTGVAIATAGRSQAKWTRAGTHIASDDAVIRSLAQRLTAGKPLVLDAAKAIGDHVRKIMMPNAGIGVLRNATEVLKTKEGVCRDYAILTAALMRSIGIPTQLVGGLVNMDGLFYYHAWVEVFDGKRWIGIDSTLPHGRVTPGHVKLAQGNIEEAFLFTFLDKVRLEVLTIEKR